MRGTAEEIRAWAVWAEDSGRSTTIPKFFRIASSALVLYEVFIVALTKWASTRMAVIRRTVFGSAGLKEIGMGDLVRGGDGRSRAGDFAWGGG